MTRTVANGIAKVVLVLPRKARPGAYKIEARFDPTGSGDTVEKTLPVTVKRRL